MIQMSSYKDIAVIGGIALIAYFILKGFGSLSEWWNKGLQSLYGMTVQEANEQVITVDTTKQVWTTEKENIQALVEYQTSQAANINMIEQYKKNVSDFTMWYNEETRKLQEAQQFITINSINPFFMLNPYNKAAMENAQSQVIDSKNKMAYYQQQIDLNKQKLRDLGVWI